MTGEILSSPTNSARRISSSLTSAVPNFQDLYTHHTHAKQYIQADKTSIEKKAEKYRRWGGHDRHRHTRTLKRGGWKTHTCTMNTVHTIHVYGTQYPRVGIAMPRCHLVLAAAGAALFCLTSNPKRASQDAQAHSSRAPRHTRVLRPGQSRRRLLGYLYPKVNSYVPTNKADCYPKPRMKFTSQQLPEGSLETHKTSQKIAKLLTVPTERN